MVRRLGDALTKLSLKYIPDPSIFAVILTFISFILGILIAKNTPMQMVINWYKGFWSLLTFSMQMALMVITASAVANAPLAKKWIRNLAAIPKNSPQAVFMVTLVSTASAMIHWGLSLALASLLAKEVARNLNRKRIPFEYGLIGAGAYIGQMVWHGGPSASVGLLIATPGHFLEDVIGVIPMSEYMFNPMNITLGIALVILPPVFAMLLHPKEKDIKPIESDTLAVLNAEEVVHDEMPANPTIGDKLNHSKIINFLLGALGAVYIVYHFATKGFNLNLDIVNSIFLFAGIFMHGTVANYVRAVKNAASGVSGIIFQFPLYAGIMGMIQYSGLVDIFAQGIVNISTPFTFPLWTFLSASIVNLFVPSGGGQWAVQGPIAMKSAAMMNASFVKTALCVAYGNTWTNMFQPFWAIALLGITGLKARDIIGYSTGVMLLSGILFIGAVLFLPV